MAEPTRKNGLAEGLPADGFGGDRVRLAVLPPRAILNLRGRRGNAHFVAAVGEVTGLQPPDTANRWSASGDTEILWLGPDEWLLMAPQGRAADIESLMRRAVPDDPWLSVVDVSHSYTGFELIGSAAREVLAKGCPLDLHPRSFGPGDCAQSLLAKIRILLRAVDRDDHFEIWLRNSFALYAASWLRDAMAEYVE